MSIYPAGSIIEVDLLLDFSGLENGPIVHFWWLVAVEEGQACSPSAATFTPVEGAIYEVVVESIRKILARAADTGHSD